MTASVNTHSPKQRYLSPPHHLRHRPLAKGGWEGADLSLENQELG